MYKDSLSEALIRILDVFLALFIFLSIRERLAFGHLIDLGTLSRIEFDAQLLFSLLLFSFLWNQVFTYAGMYHFSVYESWWTVCKRTVVSTFLGSASVILAAHLTGVYGVSSSLSRVFLPAAIASFLAYRLFYLFLRRNLARRKLRYVVIVGVNQRSMTIFKALENPKVNVTFFDIEGGEKERIATGRGPGRVEVGDLQAFNRKISEMPVDDVIVSLPVRSYYDHILKILELCAQQGVRVRLAANLFDIPSKVTRLHLPDSKEQLVLYETNLHPAIQHDLKRIIDIVGSIAGLILLAPFFLLVALVILVVDGPPVFYVQERVGYNKRRFRIFKFRTMVRNAEVLQNNLEALNEYGAGAAAFKLADDPRATRLGQLLRKTSIDELPQLLNVLGGSMSLVGPRPLPIRDFERFYNDRHRLRFSIKPGLTGLWQVSGRSDVEFEEWMGLDIKYAENWSLLLDFKIMLRTVFVVLSGKGAK